jgi:hypothetical protein
MSVRNILDGLISGSNGYVGIGTSLPSAKFHVVGEILATGDIVAFSDRRIKTDIKPIENALEKISLLEGVTYERLDVSTKRCAGLIAQDVEAVFPEVVHTIPDENLTKTIAYGNFSALLVQGIKELLIENEKIKHDLDELKAQL